MLDERGGVDVGADDVGDYALAQVVVGHADDRCLDD